MKDLLNAFVNYAKEADISYSDLAAQLEREAVIANKMNVDHYPLMDGGLRRTIIRHTPTGHLDAFCVDLSEFGFRQIPGIGEKKAIELETLMKKLNLSWGIQLGIITRDTDIGELGLWVHTENKWKSLNILTVGSYLDHPHAKPETKAALRKLL